MDLEMLQNVINCGDPAAARGVRHLFTRVNQMLKKAPRHLLFELLVFNETHRKRHDLVDGSSGSKTEVLQTAWRKLPLVPTSICSRQFARVI